MFVVALDMEPESIDTVLRRSWRVFRANPTILVPGLAVGIALGVLAAIFAIPPLPPGAVLTPELQARYALAFVLASAATVLAYVMNVAYTTGMAAAAWQRGTAMYADGARAFTRDGRNILVASLGLLAIFAVAVVLAIPTFFLSLLATVLFFMYAIPAAVVDDLPGIAALQRSARMTWRRLLPSLAIVAVLAGVEILAQLLGGLLQPIPFAGPIALAIMQQAVAAFATIVVVGEYINLQSAERVVTLESEGSAS